MTVGRQHRLHYFLGFLTSLLNNDPPWSEWLGCSQVAYVVLLTPYVLVSFYERYSVALWLPQAVFVTWLLIGCQRIVLKWTRSRSDDKVHATDGAA